MTKVPERRRIYHAHVACRLMLGVLLLAAGCASWRPAPLNPHHAAIDYFPETIADVETRIIEWTASDGARLAATLHRPTMGTPHATLACLHGIESHAGWFEGVGTLLAARGYAVYCLDRRGSGLNREPRGFASGDIDSGATWLRDISDFLDGIADEPSPRHLVGLSWGGKLAVAYAIEHPGVFDSLILITPGIRSPFNPGPVARALVVPAALLFPTRAWTLPLQPEMFSSDPTIQARIAADPLRLKQVTLRFARQNAGLDRMLRRRIAELTTPWLLLLAEDDPIIDNDGVLQALQSAGIEQSRVHVLPDQTHSIQFDAVVETVRLIDAWLRAFSAPPGMQAHERTDAP